MRNIQRFLLIAAASMALIFAQSAPKAAAGKMADKMADKAADLLDINTATQAQLEGIKGIGPKYAEAIVKGRPYTRKDELSTKKIIPDNVYEKIKPLVIAKQAAKK